MKGIWWTAVDLVSLRRLYSSAPELRRLEACKWVKGWRRVSIADVVGSWVLNLGSRSERRSDLDQSISSEASPVETDFKLSEILCLMANNKGRPFFGVEIVD